MGGSFLRMASLPRWAVNEPKVAELEVGDANREIGNITPYWRND